MLVPVTHLVGAGYNAGLTATTYALQPDAYAGAGFTSPSGRPIGGLKLGQDEAYRMVATAQRARYSQGPPALMAASESGYVPHQPGQALSVGQLAGRYMSLNGLGKEDTVQVLAPPPPFHYWGPHFTSEEAAKTFCKAGGPHDHHPWCMVAAAQAEKGRVLTSGEEFALLATLSKPPGGMVTTEVPVIEQKGLPWVLLGIAALLMVMPAFRR
jgi:hypothetical protein